MEKYVISGGKPLRGEVTISGFKNAAVAILPATVLANDVCVLENVPDISDIRAEIAILQELGARVKWLEPTVLEIDTSTIDVTEVPLELGKKCVLPIISLAACSPALAKAAFQCQVAAIWVHAQLTSI